MAAYDLEQFVFKAKVRLKEYVERVEDSYYCEVDARARERERQRERDRQNREGERQKRQWWWWWW